MKKGTADRLFKSWILVSTVLVIIVVAFIFLYLIKHGRHSISKEFIFGNPSGIPLGVDGGIWPAIVGSLALTAIACMFATILALATALYVVFYCTSERLVSIVHIIVQCMAGIPSIILGLFGYTLLVAKLNLGRSLLAAGITLGIMIFPFVQVRIEKILREIDGQLIVASYALGVSKLYTLVKLVLPQASREIISAITLGGGFAMGAAAPIMLTGAVIFAPSPKSLLSPVMALPFHLYILTGEGISLEKAYATALVLVLLVFIINTVSVALTFKQRK